MYFKKYDLRFIDSLSFFLCPLAKLPETFQIDTLKGHFPHKFNIAENQNYIGKIPSEDMFFAKNMMPKQYDEFKEWYDKTDKNKWNFKDEFINYCEADVIVLSKSILKFRKLFIEDNKLNIDPFRYTTLASLCMAIYNNRFLPEKTIVGNGANKPTSKVCSEWLIHLDNKNLMPEIPLVCVNPHKKENKFYKKDSHTFHADAFDLKKQLVKEFYGCYHHGCKKCFPDRKKKYEQTMEREQILESNGFTIEKIWGCEWEEMKSKLENKKEIEQQAIDQNIDIREALFGGRTEGFKKHVKCDENQVIYAFDVTSLYPTVNALDDYAVGFKKYVKTTPEDILSGKFFGLVKCDITPPNDLYLPVLPRNENHKLLFSLDKIKAKTFASVELKRALEEGYKITKVYSALQYKRYNGLMKDYVAYFIKMKIENSGIMTDEECQEVNEYHKNLGFKFEIEKEDCKKNPGLRMISKICLNSLWGKFGQRADLESYEFMDNYNDLLKKITDPKLETTRWDIINENCVELRFKEDRERAIAPEFISEITAIFTTANARVRLYDMLSWLHPSQIIYADTDSCYFLYDKTNPLHKKPDNNDPTLPKSVKFEDWIRMLEI
jgi:hypothetical protein